MVVILIHSFFFLIKKFIKKINMTIFQLKYGTAKLLFDSPIFKKFKGDGCYSYSLLLLDRKSVV